MPNQYVNKVQQSNGTVLIDISDTTAVASDVASGKYFYLASGEKVEGTSSDGGGTYIRTEILAQQTITPDSSQKRATLTGFTEGLTSGDYYIVTYDGTEWLLTCSVVYGNNYLVGDINYFYGSSDALPIPFGIIWVSGTTATLATYNTNQHTVKIEHLEFIEDGVTLGTKTITQNGTYSASSDSLDGFSSVTVNCGGTGLVKLASGTITGNNTYDLPVPVGKKMPKTDFWFKMVAKSTSEFTYDTNYKYAVLFGIVFSEMGQFDLSTVGDSKTLTSNMSFKINNSGTITNAASGTYIGHMTTVRNNTANTYGRFNNMRINRKSNEFQVRLYNSNNSYKAPSTITYDWELVYFGTNPSTDIVEIT